MNPTKNATRPAKVGPGTDNEINANVIIISNPIQLQNYIDSAIAKAFESLSSYRLPTHKGEAEEDPITSKELCQALNISLPTLLQHRNSGKIPYLKLGGRILYKKSSVLAALEGKSKK